MDTDLFQGIKNPLRSVENSPVKIEEKIFKILHNLIIEFFKLSAKGSFPWQSHCKTGKAGCLSRKGFVTRKQESAVSMPKQSPAAQSELCATNQSSVPQPKLCVLPRIKQLFRCFAGTLCSTLKNDLLYRGFPGIPYQVNIFYGGC